MQSAIDAIIGFLDAYPAIAYGLAFLAAAFESIPLIGAVVPGSTIILAISALVPHGTVAFWPLLLWSVLGAILGDGVSYWIGHRYQRRILGIWPFNRYPQLTARSEVFFRDHGGTSVVLGRFTPALRPFIPLFAGILGMPPLRFYAANILSAVIWAPAHIIPGVALGATLGLAAEVAGRFLALVVILILLIALAAWLARFVLRRALPRLAAVLRRLRDWAGAGDTWLQRQVLALLDPERSEIRSLVLASALLIGSTIALIAILEAVVAGEPLTRVDHAVYFLLQELRSGAGDTIMAAIAQLGDAVVIICVTLAAAAWLAWRRAWWACAYLLVAVIGASLFTGAIKIMLSHPQPMAGGGLGAGRLAISEIQTDLLSAGTFSLVSGHASVNAVLYGFLGILAVRRLPPAWGIAIAMLLAVFVVLIALARLYLGIHWLSDVASGLTLGLAWLTLLGIAYQFHHPEPIGTRGLLGVVAAVLLLAGTVEIRGRDGADIARSSIKIDTRILTDSEWLDGAWQSLPAYRTDLGGETEGPMTLQLAGNPDSLQHLLAAKGWEVGAPLSLAGAFTWLAPNPDPRAMPVLPLLQEGRSPRLSLIRVTSPTSRLVLRLWATNAALDQPSKAGEGMARGGTAATEPIWTGMVVEERLTHLVWPLAVMRAAPDGNGPRNRLIGDLPAAATENHLVMRRGIIPTASWDGRVLLMKKSAGMTR